METNVLSGLQSTVYRPEGIKELTEKMAKGRILILNLIILLFTIHYSLLTSDSYSQTAINTTGNPPNNSAMLDLSSTRSGLLINRMNTSQMTGINNPAEGLEIFNVDNNCFEAYVNGAWNIVSCPSQCSAVAAPSPVASAACDAFIVTWDPVPNANYYIVDVAYDQNFTSFLNGYCNFNIGSSTSFTVTNLNQATSYYFRVRDCNGINSAITIVTPAPFVKCGDPLPVMHYAGSVAPVTKAVTYNTFVSNIGGTTACWITQNLGASRQASAANDASYDAAGWYWQWGTTQGYDISADHLTRTPNTTWSSPCDWCGPYSWPSGSDPCSLLLGSGWRLPLYNMEMRGVVDYLGFNYRNGGCCYSSAVLNLKLHYGQGYLDGGSGNWTSGTSQFWSSQVYNVYGYYQAGCFTLTIPTPGDPVGVSVHSSARSVGSSLRCLKDM
jgi:hypothetical protein